MKRFVLALALVPLAALAGIRGESSPAGDLIRLMVLPDSAIANARASFFVAIVGLSNGEPDLSRVGWYTGREWVAGGLPRAAFTGIIPPKVATVRVPGGVCAQVRLAGGPPGDYAVFAGWGRAPSLPTTAADVQGAYLSGTPALDAQLRQLQADQAAAQGRLARYGANNDAAAFADMRANNTFWKIQTYHCQE